MIAMPIKVVKNTSEKSLIFDGDFGYHDKK